MGESDFTFDFYGPKAVLIRGGNPFSRLSLARAYESIAPPHFREWVVGYDTLLLQFNETVTENTWCELLKQAEVSCKTKTELANSREHQIPISYDGPDLERVSQMIGLTIQELIEIHSSGRYQVRFLGFSPGFAYLDGLDRRLHCPRLDQPRTQVPAGTLAIGDAHTGIYPIASPGGWNAIGHTDFPLFDAQNSEHPFRLQVGDRVRFFIQS